MELSPPTHHPRDVKNDSLDYATYASAICKLLARLKKKNTGLTIGVFGDWGIGKSSVLRMVRDLLKIEELKSEESNDDKKYLKTFWDPAGLEFLVVEFDAWRYSKQEEIWLALLRRIKRKIEQDRRLGLRVRLRLNWELWKNRLYTTPTFWRVLRAGLLVGLGLLGIAALALGILFLYDSFSNGLWLAVIGTITVALASFINATGSVLLTFLQGKIDLRLPPLTRPPFDRRQPLIIDDFLEDFRIAVRLIGYELPLIILIDDLDRCPQDQIVPVLEAMKHFGFDEEQRPFGTPGIVKLASHLLGFAPMETRKMDRAPIAFVLAADRRAIERAVEGYYKDYRGQDSSNALSNFAREYVEKIVQVPFEIPPLTRKRLQEMLRQDR